MHTEWLLYLDSPCTAVELAELRSAVQAVYATLGRVPRIEQREVGFSKRPDDKRYVLCIAL